MLLLTNATATATEPVSFPVTWPEHHQTLSPTIEKWDYAGPLVGVDRSPAIRMLEQTIVCLQELDRLGNLTIGQKIELSDLIARHGQILRIPKLDSMGNARAAGTGVGAS